MTALVMLSASYSAIQEQNQANRTFNGRSFPRFEQVTGNC